MSIVKKVVIGYIFIVFIPVIACGIYFYTMIYGSLISQFVDSRQNLLDQAYSNLRTDLTRIESVYRMMQYNSYMTDYLEGVYESDSDSVYAYIRYISPLFSQAMVNNPEIQSTVIYPMKDRIFTIPERFVDRHSLNPDVWKALDTLLPGKGVWIRTSRQGELPDFTYYQYLYNDSITERIGLLEIQVGNETIQRFLNAAGVGEQWHAFILTAEDNRILLTTEPEKSAVEDQRLAKHASERRDNSGFVYRRMIVNSLDLKELDVRILIAGRVNDVFESIRSREVVLVAIMLALLVTLSVIYYSFASAVAKRILKLARHMRAIGDSNLKRTMNSQIHKDEIGFLTLSYNAMIERLDELINHVHRAELRNKEAAYKVLQAQIKPHFLYNTLETIRMLAEANDDKEVADISYSFASLMRYSLSPQKDDTVLSKEIEMVEYYLNIHQARLGDRLQIEYDIRLDAPSVPCPRFMLQPLVENSIVHGVSVVLRPVRISLYADETDEFFRILLIDSGAGIAREKLQDIRESLIRGTEATETLNAEGGGFGLFNVSERIKAYYGGSSRLEIDSEAGKGTTLTLLLSKGTNPEE